MGSEMRTPSSEEDIPETMSIIVWHIQNFDRDFKKLIEDESLLLEIENNDQQPEIIVGFFFTEQERSLASWNTYENIVYLNMAALLISADPTLLSLKIRIEGGTISQTNTFSVGTSKPTTILSGFFNLGSGTDTEKLEKLVETNRLGIRPNEMFLRITVMPEDATTAIIPEDRGASSKRKDCAPTARSLTTDFEKMFNASDNFPDVILETNDKTTLSAHRFVLAARSPSLAKLLGEASTQLDYNGTIKIDCSSAKPLNVLLNWMYTEKISDEITNFTAEVIQLAVKLEMEGFIEALDKTLIGFCTLENMFQFYRLAREYNMNKAVADLAEFIKKNVGFRRNSTTKAIG